MSASGDELPACALAIDEALAPSLPGILVAEIEIAAAYAKASRASSTQRVYVSD